MQDISSTVATRSDRPSEEGEPKRILAFLPVRVPNKMCAVAEQAAFGPVAQEEEDEEGEVG